MRLSTAWLFPAILLCAGPAGAIEPPQAADALAKALGGSEATVTFEAVREEGGSIVVDGLVVKSDDEPEKAQIRFAQAVIAGLAEGGEGVFSAESLVFSGGEISGELTGAIGSVTLTGATVSDPAKIADDRPARGIAFDAAEALDISVTRPGAPAAITIARIVVDAGEYRDGVLLSATGAVEGITVPAEVFPQLVVTPEALGFDSGGMIGMVVAGLVQKMVVTPQALGYDALRVDLSFDASRDPAAKTLKLTEFSARVADAGTMTISAEVGNVPALRKLNDADAVETAGGVAVRSFAVRYDDQSLFPRILTLFGEQWGTTGEDYAAKLGDALPFLFPMLDESARGALGAFLKDPRSLTISVAPETPMSGGDMVKLALREPETLAARLKLTMSAND